MTPWHIWNSGPGEPAWNMAADEFLLEHAAALGAPILRLYGWTSPAATFGYFQKYADVAAWTPLRPLIRRPTAGGLVPHDRDWTYSLAFPPGDPWYALRAEQSYQQAHDWVGAAFERLKLPTSLSPGAIKDAPGQCFIGAEKFDLLHEGKKIAGAAQRRNRHGLLIQGSVQQHPASIQRAQWEDAMLAAGSDRFGADWKIWSPTSENIASIQHRRDTRFADPAFTQRR